MGEAVGGERREVDGLEAGEVAAVVEVGRREVEVGGEDADQDEVVPPGQLAAEWVGWCSLAGLAATSGSAVSACLGGSCNVESLGPW